MQNLKKTLESFSLSEDTRRKILNEDHPFGNQGTPFIPSEFKEIAQIALAGHFLVSTGIQQVTVQPTCVEFQGRRIKLRCPPKVLTGTLHPSLPSIFSG